MCVEVLSLTNLCGWISVTELLVGWLLGGEVRWAREKDGLKERIFRKSRVVSRDTWFFNINKVKFEEAPED
jgi:hypothetical protein